MSAMLTGLFLGAGASYEIGMPLVWGLTARLKNWLTPENLRALNSSWRAQGGGYSDVVIDDLVRILVQSNLHYESILGYLETQFRRHATPKNHKQEYHGLYSWLVEIIYHLLYLQHVNQASNIQRNLRYFEGIARLAASNNPLWIFSLNHDLVIECLAASYGIPLNCGFGPEIVTLPRRDKSGRKTGELRAEVISSEQLEKKGMPFTRNGFPGINLLKIHGALDVFTFRDGGDLLRLLPMESSVEGIMQALRSANEDLIYVDPVVPERPAKVINEITYADDQGELQFLRRSILSGAFKFDRRHTQVLPMRLLEYFKSHINCVGSLVCIGYGFGDEHVNMVIRGWLEFSADRRLEIVGPDVKNIPSFLLHVAPQVVLKQSVATDYLDSATGIKRERSDVLRKQVLAWVRRRRA
ncbi:MAG: hypothetical protein EOP84_08955 [Verrucomicrobiaceae bacterium]|uniref:hypothetical protein n=1 Tax=Corallococcus sp. BB11-1 TaxID=2996783 RepID=UPI0010F22607|nr:hypothetical protein [Corallococcus sp. BB11-1]MCY1033398.1 hypothetical protein [Corallococcus sp. BB11-1]RYD82742.1 MAG: hypothetical protein EOP84_08955 [Verrucomicrobiaceae bacterium]